VGVTQRRGTVVGLVTIRPYYLAHPCAGDAARPPSPISRLLRRCALGSPMAFIADPANPSNDGGYLEIGAKEVGKEVGDYGSRSYTPGIGRICTRPTAILATSSAEVHAKPLRVDLACGAHEQRLEARACGLGLSNGPHMSARVLRVRHVGERPTGGARVSAPTC
jgi:hypothetical protein